MGCKECKLAKDEDEKQIYLQEVSLQNDNKNMFKKMTFKQITPSPRTNNINNESTVKQITQKQIDDEQSRPSPTHTMSQQRTGKTGASLTKTISFRGENNEFDRFKSYLENNTDQKEHLKQLLEQQQQQQNQLLINNQNNGNSHSKKQQNKLVLSNLQLVSRKESRKRSIQERFKIQQQIWEQQRHYYQQQQQLEDLQLLQHQENNNNINTANNNNKSKLQNEKKYYRHDSKSLTDICELQSKNDDEMLQESQQVQNQEAKCIQLQNQTNNDQNFFNNYNANTYHSCVDFLDYEIQ